MSGALGLAAILFGATLMAGLLAHRPIADLSPNEIMAVGALCTTALVMAGWTINDFRHRWIDGVRALLVWSIIFAALVSGYARRDDLSLVLDRVIGEIDPGRTVTTDAGEVVVARRADGSFT